MNKRMNLNWVCFLCGVLGLSIATPLQGDELHVLNELGRLIASDGAGGDNFGYSVSVSGGTAVVGSRYDHDNGNYSGSAYVFERQEDGAWLEVSKLLASDGAGDDYFGTTVSVSGGTAIVGAYSNDWSGFNSGSAYVFERQKDGAWLEVAQLYASDAYQDDEFGWSVSVSGGTAVVGAKYEADNGGNAGAAYVFERQEDGVWLQVSKLVGNDTTGNDNFGYSVSVSGGTAVVGSLFEDDNGSNAGAAYVFEREKDGAWLQVSKLVANDGAANDYFGTSVSVSGGTVVVGANEDDDNGGNAGSAYVFERQEDGAWLEVSKLLASDGYSNDEFGGSVTVSGGVAVVGAHRNDDNGYRSGSAYMYERQPDGSWAEQAIMLPTEGGASYNFGQSVSYDGETLLIGEPFWNDSHDVQTGSTCLFSLSREVEVGGPWASTVQESIDFYSSSYHTAINIPAGTYNESLFIDKSVNLVGLDDASSCIIDASGLGGGVAEIVAGDSTFSNLTFTNGDTSLGGGGISIINNSGAILQDCIVDSNEALFGGGVYTSGNASLSLIDTEVTNNWAVDGGGLYSDQNSMVDLIGSRIAFNDAYSGGGAVFVDSNVYIDASSFSANYAAENAGMLAIASLVDVNFTIFSGNQSKTGGGGIGSDGSLVFVGESGFCQNAPVDIDGYWVDEGGNTFSADCYEIDCNQNGLNDQSEIALGLALDCNLNGVPDECDLESAFSLDCNGNSIPDECDVAEGFSQDCNGNELPDECDIASGFSQDVDGNGIPDECELDCNGNLVPDYFDIQEGTSMDCNANTVPDECDIAGGTEQDCDVNGIPDACDLAGGASDLNENGVPDSCDIANGTEMDCNENAIIDSWEIANGKAQDCNDNEIPDSCDYETGVLHDCDDNGVPDECKFADDPSLDCNENGILDLCDIDSEVSADLNSDWIPDECQCLADTDESASVDVQDVLLVIARWGENGEPGMLGDVNWDGTVGVGDLLYIVSTWGPCPE